MRVKSLVALVAIGVALIVLPAAAEETGQIFGQVRDKSGNALGGVEVTLSGVEQNRLTDIQGTFRFDRVPVGDYSLLFTQGDNSATLPDVYVSVGSTTILEHQVDWQVMLAETFTVFAAGRKTQRITEAPAAVTLVTDMDVETQVSHGQMPKLFDGLLGADIPQSSMWDMNLNVRGLNSSLNRRILVLIDGRDPVGALLGAQEWPSIAFPLDEISSMEMVRGPGSALYGANAFNGVLNLTTQEPRFSEGGFVRAAGGELDTLKLDFRQAGFITDSVSYKVFGGYENSDSFSVSRNVTQEYAGLAPEAVPLRDMDSERFFGGFRIDKLFENGWLFTAEVGDAQMEGPVFQTGIGRVQLIDSERPYVRLNFNTPHFNVLGYWDARDSEQYALSSGGSLYDDSSKFHLEVQGNISFANDRARLIGGISYREEDVDTAGPGGSQTIIAAKHNEDMQAVFAQFDFDITESLSAVIAGRYDDSSLHDAQVSPKAALVYSFSNDHSIRLKYDEAFQTPNYLDRFLRINAAAPVDLSAIEAGLAPYLGGVPLGFTNIPVLALGNEDLEVEEITSWEIGYSGIFGGRGMLSANYFQSEVENFVTELLPGVNSAYGGYMPPSVLPAEVQAVILGTLQANLPPTLMAVMSNDANGDPIFAAASYTNFGAADLEGVELGFNYFFENGFELLFNYSWLDFETTQSLPGTSLEPNAPEHRFSLGAAYNAAPFSFMIRGRWIDDFYWAAGAFEGEVPQYEVIDLSARYVFDMGLELGLNVTNALDDEHFETFGGDILGRRAIGTVGFRW